VKSKKKPKTEPVEKNRERNKKTGCGQWKKNILRGRFKNRKPSLEKKTVLGKRRTAKRLQAMDKFVERKKKKKDNQVNTTSTIISGSRKRMIPIKSGRQFKQNKKKGLKKRGVKAATT